MGSMGDNYSLRGSGFAVSSISPDISWEFGPSYWLCHAANKMAHSAECAVSDDVSALSAAQT